MRQEDTPKPSIDPMEYRDPVLIVVVDGELVLADAEAWRMGHESNEKEPE